MLSKTGRPAVFNHHQAGVVHANRVPLIGIAANQVATVGNDQGAAGTIEADARYAGKRRITNDARNRTGDIEEHKGHVARSNAAGPVAAHIPQTIGILEIERGIPGGLRRREIITEWVDRSLADNDVVI